MGKSNLRDSKVCENCGASVAVRFCSTCGQENKPTKQSFHYLFTHFLEDLTHYDNGFWKSLKFLLYKPFELTHTYLKGKRKMFVPPVKLFIFINFLTFLIFGLLPSDSPEKVRIGVIDTDNEKKIENANTSKLEGVSELIVEYNPELLKKYTIHEIGEKFIENVKHYFPKVLFLYLPFFAFVLWLFHNKKKWWYFEHGVYTLHFFSSILLLLSINAIVTFVFDELNLSILSGLFAFLTFLYIVYVFFHSHHLMYLQSRWVSHSKAVVILFINFFIMIFLMLSLFWFSFIML
ncbi:DUF3667 domain-containing protein [Flavobacterium sp. 20NA77.7]|uniref:DUF3667 domain-containing protein n=1 Tax=Flavobacterium nakdongensis TaxID=3073563 RepID=A0ABY9RCT3_9FLAO|nr:DUF3667 domain-containing protein [Flavobacterium sp. 20NA77.7]WMW78634.1 DUF3667 domain-containing protein [Flavobacterium sp. 20NA77.7]